MKRGLKIAIVTAASAIACFSIVAWLVISFVIPPGVPLGASVMFSYKDGWIWTWRYTLPQGCADWQTVGDSAWVDLWFDPQCRTRRGISYPTFSDELIFEGYWPKPGSHGGNPCPARISRSQLADLRNLVDQASAMARTKAERRVLRRIDQRLAAANGDALTTDAFGWCNDLKPEDYRGRRRVEDVWRADRYSEEK